MDWMRSWISWWERLWCSKKNFFNVPGWARCSSCKLGQRSSRAPTKGVGQVIKPPQNLGKIHFQTSGETVALACLLVDHEPPLLHQTLQLASLHRVRLPPAKLAAVMQQQIQQRRGIAWVVLGAGRREHLTVARRGGGVHGEHYQMRILA